MIELCLSEIEDNPQRWHFRVRAANGEIVAQSEGYSSKQGAQKGLRALRRAVLPQDYQAHERELNAAAWQRGWLFAYYQTEAKQTARVADLLSKQELPEYLAERVNALNPYRETPDAAR